MGNNLRDLILGQSGKRFSRPQMARRAILKLQQLLRGNNAAKSQQKIFAEMQRALPGARNAFPEALVLPTNFGSYLPERAPEILLAALTYQAGMRVLDIGHANSQPCHLDMLRSLPEPRHFTGIDIAEPVYDVSPYYENSIRGDIADESLLSEKYDLIWCISTLEHFGLDNSGYTENFQMDSSLDAKAFVRMAELLAPGGSLLVTVPYGKAENHGWMRNYDAERWKQLIGLTPPACHCRELYFVHQGGQGWKQSEPEKLANIGYYNEANSGAGAMAAVIVTRSSEG